MSERNKFGEWTHTVGGQAVVDNVPLKHESEGASDYCMHCGIDMCDGVGDKEFCEGLERARRNQINPATVVAFGCAKEAKYDMEPCKQWCGGLDCPYTRETGESDA